MIAKLKGIVDTILDDSVILDVGGVGYLVFATRKTLSNLPPVGEAVALMIDTHVREEHIHLFGFLSAREQHMFRMLMSVQGVGAKMALAVLSVLDGATLEAAIASGDVKAITATPGVGPKLATRIANELKDKVGATLTMPDPTGGADSAVERGGVTSDAVSALVNLGYGRSDAFAAVATASKKQDGAIELQTLIRLALKELSR